MAVARQSQYLDLRTVQYVDEPNNFTTEVKKVVVRILLEDRVELGATQLDDEAFEAPPRQGRKRGT